MSNVAPPARISISLPAPMVKPVAACKPPPSKTKAEAVWLPKLASPKARTRPASMTKAPSRPVAVAELRSSVSCPFLTSEPLPERLPLKTVLSSLPPTVSAPRCRLVVLQDEGAVALQAAKRDLRERAEVRLPAPLVSKVVPWSADPLASSSLAPANTVETPLKLLFVPESSTVPVPEPLLPAIRPPSPLIVPGTVSVLPPPVSSVSE